jgi:anaerobic magnesium-protoporphyrin IX monomethyl ester cyclase
MTDCLLIGFNDTDFAEQVALVRSMGSRSGAYRDIDLAFVEIDGRPMRCLEVLNHARAVGGGPAFHELHNADFLWPVILYLHSYLTHRGFASDFVNLFHLERARLRAKLLAGDVKTVAITTTLYVSPHPIVDIVGFVRGIDPEIGIIIGGPYIHNQAESLDREGLGQLMEYLGGDYYVISREGEATLAALLDALRVRRSLSDIPNLGYRREGRFVVNPLVPEANALKDNMVDYSLFSADVLGRFVSVRTAKSCPFHCAFCGFPQRAGEYQYLPVNLVEKELDVLAERGVTMVTFLDDTFNVPKKRYKQILRMMIAKQYPFRWNSFYRCDHGDDEAIELMARAGCEGVFIGAESGSDAMLERMNKTVRRKDLLYAIPRLQANGISCHSNFIVGFPGETYETVDETIDLIETARPDFFRAQLWYADPMTPIWRRRDEFGVRGQAFSWSHATMDAETACDLIDRMFLAVEHATWLPQHGFEQWSTFYLQRHGMTREQIRALVTCFNAAIKDKLLGARNLGGASDLIESMRGTVQHRGPLPAPRAIAALDGRRYKDAETYWIAEFAAPVPEVPAFGDLGLPASGITARWLTWPSAVRQELIAALCQRLGARPEAILAAGLATLISRVSGTEDVVFLTALERTLLPMRLRVSWSDDFGQLVETVSGKLASARQHARFGWPILANPLWLRRHAVTLPRFGAALAIEASDGDALLGLLGDTVRGEHGLLADLAFVLQVNASSCTGAGALRVDLVYDANRFDVELVAGLDRAWTDGLGQAAIDWAIAGIPSAASQARNPTQVDDDARAAFAF